MRVDAYFDKPLDGRAPARQGRRAAGARVRSRACVNDPSAVKPDRVALTQLVTTISEKCRVCYTCVRECPAKAIRIADGQAEVMPERCIACGNCVRVCSQKAKQVLEHASRTTCDAARSGRRRVAAMPGARASRRSSPTCDYRHAGRHAPGASASTCVHEVAFGADLVAREYRELLGSTDGRALHRHDLPGGRRLRARSTIPTWSTRWRRSSRRWWPRRASLRRLHGAELQGRLHRPVHRQEGRGRRRRSWRRGRRRAHLRRAARDVLASAGSTSPAARRDDDFDPPARRRWAASSPSPRPAPGGRHPRGPARPARSSRPTGAHDFVEAIKEFDERRPGRPAAGGALLQRLHHGRRA